MNRFWPVHALGLFCALFTPAWVECQSRALLVPSAVASNRTEKLPEAVIAYLPDNPSLPPGMLDLMRNSQARYLEGSKLIKSGESDQARTAFNKAVDLLLESGWDLNSNVEFNRFFQDLIRRIQQDESRYLRPPDIEDKPESAVVDELEKLDLIPITVDPALQDVVETDLAYTKYDIPITLNERVLQSLNYWVSKGRQLFIDGLVRSGRYEGMIEKVFREQSIPLDIMYLAQVESLFKTNAVSTQMAKGIWQFGKATALNYGLKVNSYIDERSDPEKSTIAAARYLNDLYAMFKDWTLVLAAYNCGEGKIQKLMDKSGLNSFWELADLRQNLPSETQNHVPLVMASIILAHNPEKYGLPKELEPGLVYSKIPVPRPIDLRATAKVLKISVDALKQLNPAIRGFCTPPAYPGFMLNVPAGVTRDARQKITALPVVKIRPQPELTSRHKIRAGDTLEKISHHYGVSVSALKSTNNIKSPNTLRAGSWIRVPSARTIGRSSAGAGKTSQTGSKKSLSGSAPKKPSPSPTTKRSTGGILSNKAGSIGHSNGPTALKRPAVPAAKPATKINLAPKKTAPKEIASR